MGQDDDLAPVAQAELAQHPVDVPLKHGFQGYWSRRITDEHRLVYTIAEDEIRTAACRYRYRYER